MGIASPATRASAEALFASWNRCKSEYALDAGTAGELTWLSQAEIQRVGRQVMALVASCNDEVERLLAMARPLSYAVVLSEPGGAIVDRRCNSADLPRFNELGIGPGAIWREELRGTNSIGTCLTEQRPCSVHCSEHYCRRHYRLSSASAPVFGTEGQLVAAVTLASAHPKIAANAHAFALAAVTQAACLMEERLFREEFRDAAVVALRSQPTDAPVLLALDRQLHLIAANRWARTALHMDDHRLRSPPSLWELFQKGPDLPITCSSLDVAVSWVAPDGQEWSGLLTQPERRSNGLDAAYGSYYTRPRVGHAAEPPKPISRGGLSTRARKMVLDHIEQNLDQELCVDDLAGAVGLSLHHFARAFKQSLGASPHRFLVQRRVERAAELLCTTDRPISEIASDVGFADQSHLTKNFNRYAGSSPSSFRRAKR